jgi:ankyrin repeat protein
MKKYELLLITMLCAPVAKGMIVEGSKGSQEVKDYMLRHPQEGFFSAIVRGYIDMLPELLARGADINARNSNGQNGLQMAITTGNVAIARVLLDHGFDFGDGSRYLNEAIRSDRSDMVDLFLSYGFGDENKRKELLLYAKSKKMAEVLTPYGSEINVDTPNYRTPLIKAITEGNLDQVQYLVEQGADVNKVDSQGYSPLHYAALENNFAITRYLLERGAVLTGGDNETPFELAVKRHKWKAVTALFNQVSAAQKIWALDALLNTDWRITMPSQVVPVIGQVLTKNNSKLSTAIAVFGILYNAYVITRQLNIHNPNCVIQ